MTFTRFSVEPIMPTFQNPVSTFIWGPEETDVLSGKT
ncbi:hypothetical protein T05_1359 [Trichinella murrelli]|uniref:Uncharacterized protein n=1 Tax=Trichinella murrelli TaxID=144512 RepID=A0A0V0SVB8_9BILA|nr:hypothetical protein T05_1359 [Trichinella murrelli]